MRAADPIEPRHFMKADEFYRAISPVDDRWQPDPRRWIFRGHADARWPLVPRILRGEPPVWTGLLSDEIKSGEPLASDMDARRTISEFLAVYNFQVAADRAGLAIPEDSQALRSTAGLVGMLAGAVGPGADGDGLWPPLSLLSIVGLAQHYGVPTRLLDWSWRPRIAAYIAAQEVVMARHALEPDAETMAVWALNHWAIRQGWKSAPTHVSVVTAPQASNRNLAAQAGLFTVVRHRHEGVGLDSVLAARMADPELQILGGRGVEKNPVMWKLTLPHAEAPRLLKILALDGVSAASVFPGYAGVVRSLEEQRRWQKL